ncbi:segregation and condensation protein A [Deinococcus arenicola]|uniref:ScpA family protein n=1 Tax=Deinococcus arenicola TaxID=2994950 RepID=A0ABU4DQD7_9DEIO|nr:ScpA family protein [Deinococcus sp. ZS9-10]MDV6374625.1 ScpA family protein [Deinococcus sp. ZS9-10]
MTTAVPAVSFVVELAGFSGTLAELASALRTGRILPQEVGLLTLTRGVLAWVQSLTGGSFADAHPDLLPTLATVIALKARLLLPQPGTETWHEDAPDELLDILLEGVEALAELDELVGFLMARRREREGLLPARPVTLDLPRRQRPRNPAGSLAKLVRAAQNAVRQVDTPLLSRDRLTLADALHALRAFGIRLRHFTFRGLPAPDWPTQTTYFAALLEGVKEGEFSVEQAEVYGDIAVQSHLAES